MDKLEKVKKAQACCQISMSDENPFEKCTECPYNEVSLCVEDCRSVLSKDTLELLEMIPVWNPVSVKPPVERNEKEEQLHAPRYHKAVHVLVRYDDGTVGEMFYVRQHIRGKIVERWQDDPFGGESWSALKIKYWMPFPKGYVKMDTEGSEENE